MAIVSEVMLKSAGEMTKSIFDVHCIGNNTSYVSLWYCGTI